MLAEQGVEGEGVLEALARHDFVALETEATALGVDPDPILDVTQRRGGPEVLEGVPGDAVQRLRRVYQQLEPDVAGRIIFDLGLVRRLGYYTGAVFEVYDPGMGEPLGGGGRYDDLCGRFGRDLPAVGFALGIDALHGAVAR
jgi:ATP phosphoribosyltransferase regulatory subunit